YALFSPAWPWPLSTHHATRLPTTTVPTAAVTRLAFCRSVSGSRLDGIASASTSASRLTAPPVVVLPQAPSGAGSVSRRAPDGFVSTVRPSLGPVLAGSGTLTMRPRSRVGHRGCLPARAALDLTNSLRRPHSDPLGPP